MQVSQLYITTIGSVFFLTLFFFLSVAITKIILDRAGAFRNGLVLKVFSIPLFTLLLCATTKMPHPVKKYTLSNGEKTVVFQQMRHIAGKKFYDTVHSEIQKAREDGFRVYKEGIFAGGTVQRDSIFDGEYEYYGYGYVNEPYNLGHIRKGDLIADLRAESSPDFSPEQVFPEDLGASNNNKAKRIQMDYPLFVLFSFQSVSRGYLDIIFSGLIGRSESERGNICPPSLFDHISVCKRDEMLAEYVLSDKSEQIYITYGKGHFWGFYENLKINDPRWEIIDSEVKYLN